jgi:hypothetical protein
LTNIHRTLLEKQIDGFRRWNLDELRLAKRSNKYVKIARPTVFLKQKDDVNGVPHSEEGDNETICRA